jgi:hypothetical protein
MTGMASSFTRRVALRAAFVAAPLAVVTRGEASFAELPFGEMQLGTPVGRCTLVAIRPVTDGRVPVVLRAPDGHEFLIEVLRHDPEAPGIAHAGRLGVYLHNGGSGTKETHEEEGLGAMAFAELLAAREERGLATPRLATIRDRSLR